MADGSGDGLDEVFAVLGKAFDDMDPMYQTIFILLTVYMLPKMSPHKVTQWLGINCNKETNYIQKAVKDLKEKAFIENFELELRIHDLYIEFAQRKAKEMRRWLWWKGDGSSPCEFYSENEAGFELARLEHCNHRDPSRIDDVHVRNLRALQVVGVQTTMRNLGFSSMKNIRSVTISNCKDLEVLEGMEYLRYLGWLQISEVNPKLKLPKLISLRALRHLEIDIVASQVINQLGDLTSCVHLREINVRCPSLSEFPRVNGLQYLEKVEFSMCEKVKGPLDRTNCVMLQSIVFNFCWMATLPLLTGCKKLSKIFLSNCDAVTACLDIDAPSALETLELHSSSEAASAPKNLECCDGLRKLQLWNMRELTMLPSFRRFSNLTVLELVKCGIREPPDLTSCSMLEDVYFFSLECLERFPNFSLLKKLKKLYLCNCITVRLPPDICGCHELKVFDLLYNDNMKGLPKMDGCPLLEEIKLSWHAEDGVIYEEIDPDSCEVDDLQSCLEHFKDETFTILSETVFPEALKEWQWLKGKIMLVKRYFRGVKLYYSLCLTAPYESYNGGEIPRPLMPGSITLRNLDGIVPFFEGEMVDASWENTVRGYLTAKKDILRATASGASR